MGRRRHHWVRPARLNFIEQSGAAVARSDDRAYTVTLTLEDCDLLWREAEDVHRSNDHRTARARSRSYKAVERPAQDAEPIFFEAVYAAGVIYTFESGLDALVVRSVHRAAGYEAELLLERDTWDEEQQEERPPLHYVVTSRTPAWTSAPRE
jgi:hypothetical protein